MEEVGAVDSIWFNQNIFMIYCSIRSIIHFGFLHSNSIADYTELFSHVDNTDAHTTRCWRNSSLSPKTVSITRSQKLRQSGSSCHLQVKFIWKIFAFFRY